MEQREDIASCHSHNLRYIIRPQSSLRLPIFDLEPLDEFRAARDNDFLWCPLRLYSDLLHPVHPQSKYVDQQPWCLADIIARRH